MQNPTRRRVLAAGLAGTAVAVTGQRAAASTAGQTPPGRPTEADVALLGFAQELELAARDLYGLAIDAGAAGTTDRTLIAARSAHQASADAYSAMLGRQAPNRANADVVDEWSSDFDSDDLVAVAAAAYELESIAAATHAELLGQLEGLDGAKLVASIVNAESRMCTVFADLSGQGDDLDALFVNEAEPLSPDVATES